MINVHLSVSVCKCTSIRKYKHTRIYTSLNMYIWINAILYDVLTFMISYISLKIVCCIICSLKLSQVVWVLVSVEMKSCWNHATDGFPALALQFLASFLSYVTNYLQRKHHQTHVHISVKIQEHVYISTHKI